MIHAASQLGSKDEEFIRMVKGFGAYLEALGVHYRAFGVPFGLISGKFRVDMSMYGFRA